MRIDVELEDGTVHRDLWVPMNAIREAERFGVKGDIETAQFLGWWVCARRGLTEVEDWIDFGDFAIVRKSVTVEDEPSPLSETSSPSPTSSG